MSIHLGKSVIVSDPTYNSNDKSDLFSMMSNKLTNILEGEYKVHVLRACAGGEKRPRNAVLTVVHSRHARNPLAWKKHRKHVDVDAGHAGIFDAKSYYNDESVADMPWLRKKAPWSIRKGENGALWNAKMADMTLNTKEGWGVYGSGVVSSSGLGDGGYDLYTAKQDGKVVGICIDFAVEKQPNLDFYLKKRKRSVAF